MTMVRLSVSYDWVQNHKLVVTSFLDSESEDWFAKRTGVVEALLGIAWEQLRQVQPKWSASRRDFDVTCAAFVDTLTSAYPDDAFVAFPDPPLEMWWEEFGRTLP